MQLDVIQLHASHSLAWHVARSMCRVSQRSIATSKGTGRHHMFTRRQAIRWAELWLSCWNDADFDTLLAMHRDDTRFGVWDAGAGPADRSERGDEASLGRRCRSGFTQFQWSSTRWRGTPSRGRSRLSMSRTLRACSCVAATWCSSIPPVASSQENRVSGPSWKTLTPLCSRTLANGFSARVQEDDDADQNSSNDHSTDRDRRRRCRRADRRCRIERAIAQRT